MSNSISTLSYGHVTLPATVTDRAKELHSQLLAAIDASGFTRLRTSTDIGTIIYRWPPLGPNNAESALLIVNLLGRYSTGTTISISAITDYDPQELTDATHWDNPARVNIANGNFASHAWPSSGAPVLGATINDFSTSIAASVNSCIFTVAVSEYGIFMVHRLTEGGLTQTVAGIVRPMSAPTMRRTIEVRSSAAAFPLTLSAPADKHIQFSVDGITQDITFTTGTPLSAYRIAQEITLQSGGLLEAEVDFGKIVVRIPSDHGPIFSASITPQQQLAVTFIDSSADALGFYHYKGNATTITSSTFHVDGFCWPLLGVRPGALIYNRTQDESSTVTGFETTNTQDDTIQVASSGWIAGDEYLVLLGPETPEHAANHHGGCYVAVPQAASTVTAQTDGEVALILSDRYGEARPHFRVGQNLMVVNNGAALTITVADASAYAVHDTFTAITSGTVGVIRHIYSGADELILDIISGPGTLTNPAFVVGETITGVLGGASTITSIRSCGDDATEGWYQRAPITAIAQVSASDYRTVLTLDFSAMPHTSAVFSPGMVVGVWAKQYFAYVGLTSPIISHNLDRPHAMGQTVTDTDVNRNDVGGGATAVAWEPDYETGSLQLAEIVVRGTDADFGSDYRTVLPMLRAVSARGDVAVLALGDTIDEDGDSRRRWTVIAGPTGVTGAYYGASTTTNPPEYLVIGPGTE